jgi:hypothetical protein
MSTSFALFAAIGAALLATIACAISVFVYSKISKQATSLRSMISLQGELIEIRDFVSKIDAWAKRINSREVMRERHADGKYSGAKPTRSSGDASGLPETKDDLRRRAGIIAGRPAPHTENL